MQVVEVQSYPQRFPAAALGSSSPPRSPSATTKRPTGFFGKMDWSDVEIGFRLGCTAMLFVWVRVQWRAVGRSVRPAS